MPHPLRFFPLRILVASGVVAGSLAACNAPEPDVSEAAAQAPEPVLTPAPVPTAAADGTTIAAGQWDVNEAASGAQAVFRSDDGTELLALRCDVASGAVTMTIAANEAAAISYRIDAGGEAARLDLSPFDGGLVAEIEPRLAIFYAFAQPGQVVALTSPAGIRTQFPTHPGIDRVLNACS